MKKLAMACLIGLAFFAVGCRQDEGPPPQYSDTYAGSGSEVFHLGAAGESFGYSLDLGTAVKDVYFIFTNPSSYAKPNPTVAASIASKGYTPGTSRSPFVPPAGVALRGTPEISQFNNHPPLEVVPRARDLSVFPPPSGPSYDTVGLEVSFKYDAAAVGLISATCRKVVSGITTDVGTKTLNVWVADDCWESGGTKARLVTQTMVDALAARFLVAGADNDIYDWVTTIYGEEWGATSDSNLIAPNDEVTILLYDIQGDNEPDGGVVGFFWGKDNYNASRISYSNERIMFYIDAVMYANADGAWQITDAWPAEVVSTLAHEFQHMIHFYQKTLTLAGGGTETWLNEMLSMATEDIVADRILVNGPRGVSYSDPTAGIYPLYYGRLPLYNYYNDISLTYWPENSFDPAALLSYSINYAFGAYLVRNYGGAPFLRNVMLNAHTGADAVEYALTVGGYALDFATVLQRWAAANLLSDDTATPAGYRYNAADWFTSSVDGVDYNLGSINLYNYVFDPGGIDQVGPYIYSGAPIGAFGSHPGAANIYYRLGSDLTGKVHADVSMGSGVRFTAVVKDD